MKFQHGILVSALALTGLLSACGGSNDDKSTANGGNQNPTVTTELRTYSGVVTDEHGSPVSGLSIRLENRITDEEVEVITAADGSFSAQVPPGIYDIIHDDEDDVLFDSLQNTAVDLHEDRKENIQLQTAGRSPANMLSGSVKSSDGTPGALRKLLIFPSIARAKAGEIKAEVPDPILVQTDSQGNFSTSLGMLGMDIDFDVYVLAPDAPELDLEKLKQDYPFSSAEEAAEVQERTNTFLSTFAQESVDIEKPNGAMKLNIVIGSATRNLRSATGAPSVVPADADKLAEFEREANALSSKISWLKIKNNVANSFLSMIPSAYAGELLKKFIFISDKVNKAGATTKGVLVGGKIAPSKDICKHTSFLEINNGNNPFNNESTVSASRTKFCVTQKFPQFSMFFFFNHEINLLTDKPSYYRFTDESNDTYSLRVTNTYYSHSLKYRSKKPAIIDIEFHKN